MKLSISLSHFILSTAVLFAAAAVNASDNDGQQQIVFGPVAEIQAALDPLAIGHQLLSEATSRLSSLAHLLGKDPRATANKNLLLQQADNAQIGTFYADRRLVQTDPNRSPRWMTEDDIHTLRRLGVKFMDVTDHQSLSFSNIQTTIKSASESSPPKLPKQLVYQDTVRPIISEMTTDFMESTLNEFSNKFYNRYYDSENGKASSHWLLKQIQGQIDQSNVKRSSNFKANVTAIHFEHEFMQPSIIARFEGQDEKLVDETVIISAHQDSVNSWIPWFGRAPGADDDGSGTVTIFEAFRTLLKSMSTNPKDRWNSIGMQVKRVGYWDLRI